MPTQFRLRLLAFLTLPFLIAALCQGSALDPALAQPELSGTAVPVVATPVLVAIGADADPQLIAQLPFQTRTFAMGTAGFVPVHFPDSSEADWQDFFQTGAASYGGVFGIHVNAAEKTDENHVLEQAVLGFEHVQGVETYLAISYGKEDGPFTEAMGEQLLRVAGAAAEKYQPGIMSLGVESNSLYLFHPETYDLYIEYARRGYDAVKAVSPGTLVMNNFQLDRMRGQTDLTGESFEPHWELIERFEGKQDLVSFTVYPYLHYATVDQIPTDYLAEIRSHTDLPVMITETGWPTEDTLSGVSGSDQAQIDYLVEISQQANEIGVNALIWVLPHDAEFGIGGGIFDHISLLHNDGQPKPAYDYWKAINALPLRAAP
jgi:hypothetical protein